jgi:S-adenosylmethionine/arginine decarboxylase-like enzyme
MPLSGERIEVRRLDDWMAVAAQVAVAEIIDINQHDVGPSGVGGDGEH